MSNGAAAPPLLSIIGKKNSGKTTTLVRLAAELTSRGWRVATIKHSHGFQIDHEGRDTFRHRYEGNAVRTVIASDDEFAVTGSWPAGQPLGPRELAERFLSDADLVLVEGYHGEALPTIEIFRAALHARPWYEGAAADHYLAIVSDTSLDAHVPVLNAADPDIAAELADLVEASLRGSRHG